MVQRLKLKYDEPLSNFTFDLNLRRYDWVNHSVDELNNQIEMFEAEVESLLSDQAGGLLRTGTRPTSNLLVLLSILRVSV